MLYSFYCIIRLFFIYFFSHSQKGHLTRKEILSTLSDICRLSLRLCHPWSKALKRWKSCPSNSLYYPEESVIFELWQNGINVSLVSTESQIVLFPPRHPDQISSPRYTYILNVDMSFRRQLHTLTTRHLVGLFQDEKTVLPVLHMLIWHIMYKRRRRWQRYL